MDRKTTSRDYVASNAAHDQTSNPPSGQTDVKPVYVSVSYAQSLTSPKKSRHFWWRAEKRGHIKAIRLSNSPKGPKLYRLSDVIAVLEGERVEQ